VTSDGIVQSPMELLGVVRTVPFMAPRRMVVVDRVRAFRRASRTGATGAAGPAASEGAPAGGAEPGLRGSGDAGSSETQGAQGDSAVDGGGEGWESLITGVPDTACLVLCLEAPPDARLRLTRLASEKGQLVDCDSSGRGGATLAGRAVRERAAELGVRLGWRELSLLLATVGTDCGRLVAELEKIALYCGDRPPSQKDILLLCARTAEGDIWQLLDAVEEMRAGDAVHITRAALARGESPVALVASLASQVRMMARALERVQSGVKPGELATALGANRYWVEQSLRRARRFSLDALYGAICELAHLDRAIKTGGVDAAAGVEGFVLGLCAARASTP